MGSGENLLVVGSEPPYEQGLREVVRYQRGVCLRGDGSNHSEALSSCLGFIKQFLYGVLGNLALSCVALRVLRGDKLHRTFAKGQGLPFVGALAFRRKIHLLFSEKMHIRANVACLICNVRFCHHLTRAGPLHSSLGPALLSSVLTPTGCTRSLCLFLCVYTWITLKLCSNVTRRSLKRLESLGSSLTTLR